MNFFFFENLKNNSPDPNSQPKHELILRAFACWNDRCRFIAYDERCQVILLPTEPGTGPIVGGKCRYDHVERRDEVGVA